ncbi:MAG: hypothetical protein ABSF98_18065 [Bryobacteraceae bacterium]|jgi:PIN domain nuclease of toxin-antitoxin system
MKSPIAYGFGAGRGVGTAKGGESWKSLIAQGVVGTIFRRNERGAEMVALELAAGLISAVNAGGTMQVLVRGGLPLETIVDFTSEHAALATRIMIGNPQFRARGISFGEGACMATALQRGLAVMTADRAVFIR